MGAHGGVLNAEYFGLKGNDTDEDMTKVNALISHAINNTNKERRIIFPAGTYRFPSTIQINGRGIRLIGEQNRENDAIGGTRFNYSGIGPMIQLGTDSGNPYSSNEYNGPSQAFEMSHIGCGSTRTDGTLAGGYGTYGVGTQGLVDWRSGDLRLINCRFQRFETGIFMVQSDINVMYHLLVTQNKKGIYIGPRCDQQRIFDWYSFQNDMAVHIDGARGVTFFGGEWVDDGTANNASIVVNATTNIPAKATAFFGPWLETFGSNYITPAFFDIAVADTVMHEGFSVYSPYVVALPASGKYIMRVNNAVGTELLNPHGESHVQGNFVRYVQTLGSASPDVRIRAPGFRAGSQLWEKDASSTGTPTVVVDSPRGWGGSPSFSASSGLGTSPSGISMSGNQDVGELSFTTGTTPPAGNVQLGTVTFHHPFGQRPRHIEIVGQNQAGAEHAWAIYVPRSSITTTGYQLWITSGDALAASTAYQFSYRVVS